MLNPAQTEDKKLKSKTTSLGSVTIGSAGYVSISALKPSDITPIFAVLENYGSATPAPANPSLTIVGSCNTIIGPASTTYTNFMIKNFTF